MVKMDHIEKAYPTLYRKRIIPDECVKLKDDIILHMDDTMLVTKWQTLKPRKDFHHGHSLYLFGEGIKVSKFLREDGSLYYWYCDIVDFTENREENTLIVTDLLVDITLDSDNRLDVLDVDELVEAFNKGLITDGQFHRSVERLGKLIESVHDGSFGKYRKIIEEYA